jgi:hypothetical protein
VAIIFANIIWSFVDVPPYWFTNNPIIIILTLILFTTVLTLVFFVLDYTSITNERLGRWLIVYTLAVGTGLILIYGAPLSTYFDPMHASNGHLLLPYDPSATYIERLPQQLGIVMLFQLIFLVFGQGVYQGLWIINILAVVTIVYFLPKITTLLFANKATTRAVILLLFCCVPLFSFITWPYNDLVSLAPAVVAIFFLVKGLEVDKKKFLIFSGLAIMLSIIFRGNAMIIAIAMGILYLWKTTRHTRGAWFGLIAMILIIIGGQQGIRALARGIFNWRDDQAYSIYTWIGMPLQTAESLGSHGDTFTLPGWHNNFGGFLNVDVIWPDEFQTFDSFDGYARRNIMERWQFFATNPAYASVFFGQRFVSTWTNASIGTDVIYYQQYDSRRYWQRSHFDAWADHSGFTEEKKLELGGLYTWQSPLAVWMIEGGGDKVLETAIMKPFFILVFISVFSLIITTWKKITANQFVLLLIFFGGFLFHQFIWETKDRYILAYFILLLPLAAGGLSFWWQKLQPKVKKLITR